MSNIADSINRIAQCFSTLNEELGTKMTIEQEFHQSQDIVNINIYRFRKLQAGQQLPDLFEQLEHYKKTKIKAAKQEERKRHNERVKKAYYEKKGNSV